MYVNEIHMEAQKHMTATSITNVLNSLNEKPISVRISTTKTGETDGFIIKFPNYDKAKQAFFSLNGKVIPDKRYPPARFKLTLGKENYKEEHHVWVGDLTSDVTDITLYSYFATYYSSLCYAKVIVDSRLISKGFGFIRFFDEADYKHCMANMFGATGLGGKHLKVSMVSNQHETSSGPSMKPGESKRADGSTNSSTESLKWKNYYVWNEAENNDSYTYKPIVDFKNNVPKSKDTVLVDYNTNVNVDLMNSAAVERDFNLWDALECGQWCPRNSLNHTYRVTLNTK